MMIEKWVVEKQIRDLIGKLILPDDVFSAEKFLMQSVCAHLGVSEAEVLRRTRKREIVRARQIIHFLSYKKKMFSSRASVGAFFGGFDDSTVANGIKKVENEFYTNSEFYNLLSVIAEDVSSKSLKKRFSDQPQQIKMFFELSVDVLKDLFDLKFLETVLDRFKDVLYEEIELQ